MFDANARHLAKGRKFFGKVHYCMEDSPMYALGIRGGDLLFCEMLDDCHDNPRVLCSTKEVDFIRNSWEDGEGSWIVFEGTAELTGFLDNKEGRESLACAKQILEEKDTWI